MNTCTKIFLLWTLTFVLACETNPTNSNSGNNVISTDTISTDTVSDNEAANTDDQATLSLQDCEITEKHYDNNIFLAPDEAQLISIVANESTIDPNLGDSHRILKVLDAKNCSTILEETLPINRSADFPYYLAPGTYNLDQQIIAIQGFSSFYYYDLKNQNLVGPIVPQFDDELEAVDAQSGMIKGLTIWGQYLLGHALDFGNFAYDISDAANPTPVLPSAKYLIPNTSEYKYLFLLETTDKNYQAIIPTHDLDAGGNTFDLFKLFKSPLPINPQVAPNVRDNRYIVFTQNGITAKVVVDMFNKRQVPIPEDIAKQSTSTILEWLKTNG
jgi:hypothetical protein